jgi:hypothetical protein
LAIAVAQPGDVTVGVNREGIDAATQTVKAHRAAAIAWTATADGEHGAVDSTVITFSFDAAVAGLTAGHITLGNDTGALVRGALAGEGKAWTLGITVQTPGTVKLAINKPGVEGTEKTVTVFKAGEHTDSTYTALANGKSNTADSTAIAFTFETPVTGLTAEDIALANGTGAVARGVLAGEGAAWTLGITVQTAGTVKVRINKPGIEGTEKTLIVHKALPPLPLTDSILFASEEYSSGTAFESGQWTGQGTAAEGWTLSVTEQSRTWFAVYKKAVQTITPGGADGARVSMVKTGITASGATDDGLTANDTLAVFMVKTGDLVFDGGTRTFALNVSEPGALPLTVTITLNVTTNHTGAAVFRLAEKAGDVEFLDRVGGDFDGLVSAFTWVETNAEAATEYTIRVEKDETDLPHLIVSLNRQEGASLRLRGTAQGPWKLELWEVTSDTSKEPVNVGGFFASPTFIQVGNVSTANSVPLITFILGRNITIQSGNTYATGKAGDLFHAGAGGTVVLEPGSMMQDHYNQSARGLIRATTKSGANGDPHFHGRVRILGGSIVNCTVRGGNGLIYFDRAASNFADGSFYLAPNSGLTLSDNDTGDTAADAVVFDSTAYSLSGYLASGASWPPMPAE